MNKQARINKCMRLVDSSYRTDFNSVRLNAHNSLEHELAKAKLAYLKIKEGKTILTEVIFKNQARADILVLEDFQVIEILHSETKEEALTKLSYYPKEIDILFYTSEEVLKDVR